MRIVRTINFRSRISAMEVEIDNARRPLHLRLPFLRQDTGLGDAVARITQSFGAKPCEPCKKRQEALNRAVQLQSWRT